MQPDAPPQNYQRAGTSPVDTIVADIPLAERSFRFVGASFRQDVELERATPGLTQSWLRDRSGCALPLVDLALRTYWAAVITAAGREDEPEPLHPADERCYRCATASDVHAHMNRVAGDGTTPPVIHWGLPADACPLLAQDPKDCDQDGQHEHVYVGG